MTAETDTLYSVTVETFLSDRQIFAVEISQTDWSQIKNNHVLPTPSTVDDFQAQSPIEAWNECTAGDIVIGFEMRHGDAYFYGLGVVTETPIADFGIDELPDALCSDGDHKTVFWTPIISNGEKIDSEPVDSPPESEFAEVEDEYLRDILTSTEAETADLTARRLLHRLIAADQLRNIDSLLDDELPGGWDDSDTQTNHVRAVALETLVGRNSSNSLQSDRDHAQTIVADRIGVDPDTIGEHCGSHLYANVDGIDDYLQDGFDEALIAIEDHIRSFDRVPTTEDTTREMAHPDTETLSKENPELFLVPAGRDSDNLDRTIGDPVEKSTIEEHDPAVDLDFFDGDSIPIWGHQDKKPLAEGDIVLLYKEGEYHYAARVVEMTHNPGLAEEIWVADDDETFEYIFYLEDKREIDLSAEQLNAVVDYQLNFVPNGFMRPADSGIDLLREKFGSLEDFLEHITVTETPDRYRRIADQLQDTKQVVFHGPPGTGKTFHAKQFADWWVHEHPETVQPNQQTRVVTFHPSFSYEDFIEGLTTTSNGDTVTYEMDDGVMKTFEQSMTSWDANEECGPEAFDAEPRYILIIDEINRGNIASILGELVTLLEADKREGADNELSINLAHSDDEFTLPSNLYIIGTMNTADRSITLVDAAIRRRFGFIAFPPEYDVLADKFDLDRDTLSTTAETPDLDGLHAASILALQSINTAIRQRGDLGKGKQLGHSYLLATDSKAAVVRAWKYELLPLLEEYFFESFDEITDLLDAEHDYYLLDMDHEQIRREFGSNTNISEAEALHKVLTEIAAVDS